MGPWKLGKIGGQSTNTTTDVWNDLVTMFGPEIKEKYLISKIVNNIMPKIIYSKHTKKE